MSLKSLHTAPVTLSWSAKTGLEKCRLLNYKLRGSIVEASKGFQGHQRDRLTCLLPFVAAFRLGAIVIMCDNYFSHQVVRPPS